MHGVSHETSVILYAYSHSAFLHACLECNCLPAQQISTSLRNNDMPITTKIQHLSSRKTKIIATLGPASNDADTIRSLINAGVNAFRLNMSHGDHESHRQIYEQVRTIATELNEPIAIFADLCGPKIRVGKFNNGCIEVTANDQVVVTTREVLGDSHLIPSQYAALAEDVTEGDRILLDDGKLELRVEKVENQDIICRVVFGGELKNHKGINLPGVNVSCPSMTDQDYHDAAFAMELGVDYLALSFVRKVQDIWDLRELIHATGKDTNIIAKIEKPEALDNAQAIIEATDAIMVARGDLGVELNPEEVPIAQYQLINSARALNKPVIVATQMLESMMENARPTRAEVTDVSNAVFFSTDAVMLSGETAAGRYPVQTVEMMARIIAQTEAFMANQKSERKINSKDQIRPLLLSNAIADAAALLCSDLHAKAIIGITGSGMSVVKLSSARPTAPLIAITDNYKVCLRMNLFWGVVPIYSEKARRSHPNHLAREVALATGLVKKGDYIIVVRGFHKLSEINSPTITAIEL